MSITKMTLMSDEKYIVNNVNKWKNGHGDNGELHKPKAMLSFRTTLLLFVAIVLIVVLKFLVVLTGKPVTFLLIDFGIYAHKKVEHTSNWLSNCNHLLWPSIKGLSWTIGSWTLLYLDSNRPGADPPVTLSPSRTRSNNRTAFHHIGYLTSLAIGAVIFLLNITSE